MGIPNQKSKDDILNILYKFYIYKIQMTLNLYMNVERAIIRILQCVLYFSFVLNYLGPLGQFSHRVAMSVSLSVCVSHCETPTSEGQKKTFG